MSKMRLIAGRTLERQASRWQCSLQSERGMLIPDEAPHQPFIAHVDLSLPVMLMTRKANPTPIANPAPDNPTTSTLLTL